jgi:trk system potassium uptake protein TrkH
VIDLRPVNSSLGILIAALGTMKMVPAMVDLIHGDPGWLVFVTSALITVFIGAMLWLTGRQAEPSRLSVRQAFILTSLSWVVLSAFAAIPFMLSTANLSFTRAYFEAMAGLTTAGTTVLGDLDILSPGVLIWRSLLQWYGGVGIIVVAIAILPTLQVGGMQLFRTEFSEKTDKMLPRVTQIANGIISVYFLLTLLCAGAYFAAGMSTFDAVNHAMTTLATGGFSTKDASLAAFKSTTIDYIAIVFMMAGALPILLYMRAFGGDPLALLRNTQVRLFFTILLALTIVVVIQMRLAGVGTGEDIIRLALFNVTALLTTTGFVTTGYGKWTAATEAVFFMIMFIGACTGSTAGGIKIFRVAIVAATIKQHLKRVIYPNGVFPIRYGGVPIGDDVAASVMSFLFLYMLTFIAVAVILSVMGYDFLTAFSASVACLTSVGASMGPILGVAGHYGPLKDEALWLLAFTMVVGRLELLTVYVLLLPRFWRR